MTTWALKKVLQAIRCETWSMQIKRSVRLKKKFANSYWPRCSISQIWLKSQASQPWMTLKRKQSCNGVDCSTSNSLKPTSRMQQKLKLRFYRLKRWLDQAQVVKSLPSKGPLLCCIAHAAISRDSWRIWARFRPLIQLPWCTRIRSNDSRQPSCDIPSIISILATRISPQKCERRWMSLCRSKSCSCGSKIGQTWAKIVSLSRRVTLLAE